MSDQFFKQGEEPEVQSEAPEKIKLGDKEYTQDELLQKVGLGDKYTELETKYNTKLDSVVPAWSKASQEAAELRKYKEQVEAEREQNEKAKEMGYTPEQRENARKQLIDILGFEPVGRDQTLTEVKQFREAERLLEDVDSVLKDAQKNGNPVTSKEDLVQFMAQTGINNPHFAYKMKFEQELDQIREQKLASIKPTGYQTIQGSTAGSKEPKSVKVTKDNSAQLIAEILSRPKV